MSRRTVIALILLGFITRPGFAFGNETTKTSSHSALRLGRTALENYRNGRWQQALTGFLEADRAMHSPVFGLYVALCQKNLGRWLNARDQLEKIVTREIPADAPTPWAQAQVTATVELAKLKNAIPKVDVRIVGIATSTISVLLDENPLEFGQVLTAKEPTRLELDPGRHLLQVFQEGRQIDARTFELEPDKPTLIITLGPYERSPVITPVAITPSMLPVIPRSDARATQRVPDKHPPSISTSSYVAIGLGVVGTCLGAATGVMAWRDRNSILRHCSDRTCPNEYASRLDRARLYGNLSTAAFTAGGVGFVIAGVSIYSTPKTSPKQSSLELGLFGRF